jgi:hypothetical protein
VTFGPTLSTELQAEFDASVAGAPRNTLTKKHIVEAIARAPRENVERWLRARMLISVLASAAITSSARSRLWPMLYLPREGRIPHRNWDAKLG